MDGFELSGLILALLTLGMLARLLHVQNKIRKETKKNRVYYQQVEALFNLHSQIQLNAPLPPMRKWAISPDFAVHLLDEMMKKKALHVVDFGSGISTLLAAYAIKKYAGQHIEDARIYSFDHEEVFIEKTRGMLAQHGHRDIVELVHAPLKTMNLDGESYSFYDPQKLDAIQEIDFVTIDGPHGPKGILDRYPALPLTFDKMVEGAVVIVDDAGNFQESKTLLNMWQCAYPTLQFVFLQTDKGTAIFRKVKG